MKKFMKVSVMALVAMFAISTVADAQKKPVAKAGVKAGAKAAAGANDNVLTLKANGVEFKMVKVQGGKFQMGCDPEAVKEAYFQEGPVHSVTLSTYYIGETEVTQALWTAVMGKHDNLDEKFVAADKPVHNVTWDECQAFVKKLSELTGQEFRLPTEAEWEFAARGGMKSKRTKYSGGADVKAVAWYQDICGDDFSDQDAPNWGLHPVKKKAANELGLYDMSGNVREYCQDVFGQYTAEAQTNPKGPKKDDDPGYVIRGGGWDEVAEKCRVTYREGLWATHYSNDSGLRLALTKK